MPHFGSDTESDGLFVDARLRSETDGCAVCSPLSFHGVFSRERCCRCRREEGVMLLGVLEDDVTLHDK